MRCKFCSESAFGTFELTATIDGIKIQYPLCVPDALLIQSQGYHVILVKKFKEGEI